MSSSEGPRKVHDNREYSEDARTSMDLDFLDAKADGWMVETGTQQMLDAISSAFFASAPPQFHDRFRQQLATIAHQCFVEGAFRAWDDIAEQGGLIRIVAADNDDATLQTANAAMEARIAALTKALEAVLPYTEAERLQEAARVRLGATRDPIRKAVEAARTTLNQPAGE